MNRKTYARAHKVSKLNSPAIAYYADSYIRGFGHQLVAGVFMTLLSTVPHSLSRAALMISATRSLAQQKKWFRSRYPALLMITFLWLLVENSQIHDGSQFMPWSFVFHQQSISRKSLCDDATDVPCHVRSD